MPNCHVLARLNTSACFTPVYISSDTLLLAGTIGHVAHGKSTVVKAISGVQTVRFKNELERNITIKLGYANAKIYKARDARVPRPWAYKAFGSSKEDNPPCDYPGFENTDMELVRHVSFVDCPGKECVQAGQGPNMLLFLKLDCSYVAPRPGIHRCSVLGQHMQGLADRCNRMGFSLDAE